MAPADLGFNSPDYCWCTVSKHRGSSIMQEYPKATLWITEAEQQNDNTLPLLLAAACH